MTSLALSAVFQEGKLPNLGNTLLLNVLPRLCEWRETTDKLLREPQYVYCISREIVQTFILER